jgi:hypothetical protein
MSEAASLAMPVAHEVTNHADSHSHATETPIAQSFAFSTQRWKRGITHATSGTGVLVMGVFLLTQISSTPGLAVQLAILGAVCSVGGLALLTKAVGDLFGRLVIDETGIAVRPSITGYSIAWNELSRWDVDLDAEFSEAHSVRFWTPDSPCAMFLSNSSLTHHDRTQIRRALLAHAADKANPPRQSLGQ